MILVLKIEIKMQSDVKVRCYNSESMMFIINGTQIDITRL